MFVEGDTDKVKSWEVERLVDKREVARGVEYLVRWKGWGEEHDVWRSLPELGNAMDLVRDYEHDHGGELPGNDEDQPKSPPALPPSTALVPRGQKFAVVVSRRCQPPNSICLVLHARPQMQAENARGT